MATTPFDAFTMLDAIPDPTHYLLSGDQSPYTLSAITADADGRITHSHDLIRLDGTLDMARMVAEEAARGRGVAMCWWTVRLPGEEGEYLGGTLVERGLA